MDALQNDQMCRSIVPSDDVSIASYAFKGTPPSNQQEHRQLTYRISGQQEEEL
jgi:hypothetical protein